MRELEIIIAGHSGSGKSTMALLLEKFLKENGFEVEFNLQNELIDYGTETNFRNLIGTTVAERVNAIKDRTKITLKQMQLKNEPNVSQTQD